MSAASYEVRRSALDDCHLPDVRERLAAGEGALFGTPAVLAAGAYMVALTWDGTVFRTFDFGLEMRGVFASWHAAEVDMLAAVAKWRDMAVATGCS